MCSLAHTRSHTRSHVQCTHTHQGEFTSCHRYSYEHDQSIHRQFGVVVQRRTLQGTLLALRNRRLCCVRPPAVEGSGSGAGGDGTDGDGDATLFGIDVDAVAAGCQGDVLVKGGRSEIEVDSREQWIGVLKCCFGLNLDDLTTLQKDRLWAVACEQHEEWKHAKVAAAPQVASLSEVAYTEEKEEAETPPAAAALNFPLNLKCLSMSNVAVTQSSSRQNYI